MNCGRANFLSFQKRLHVKHRSLLLWIHWSISAVVLGGFVWLYWAHTHTIKRYIDTLCSIFSPPMFPYGEPPNHVFAQARSLLGQGKHLNAIKAYEQYLAMERQGQQKIAATLHDMARLYLALDDIAAARVLTDRFYAEASGEDARRVEPAYNLCHALRKRGHYALAYYYYLYAKSLSNTSLATTASNPHIPVQPDIYDYLLDFEKSILWSYVGDIDERHSKLHGLSFSMQLLEKSNLPQKLQESVFSNLQYYTPNLRGFISVLRPEMPIEDEWRYSTPTFLDGETTLIRVVNYYVAEDGSYHVSPNAGKQVNTMLVLADTDEAFAVTLSSQFRSHAEADHLLHPDAYILGLEDTRVVRDASRNGTIYTLSASEQFSEDGRVMNQVLGMLDLETKSHIIDSVIKHPNPDYHDKNWVFAGGLDCVVYGWYPSIEIGAINQATGELHIHTRISSPHSFYGMRGSTNGVLYENQWWFVTHAVIHRPGQMRMYLHRLVVLNGDLSRVVRHSLPFTFEEHSHVEYCLGLFVDASGLTFGYSVRDRCSKILRVPWRVVGELI